LWGCHSGNALPPEVREAAAEYSFDSSLDDEDSGLNIGPAMIGKIRHDGKHGNLKGISQFQTKLNGIMSENPNPPIAYVV